MCPYLQALSPSLVLSSTFSHSFYNRAPTFNNFCTQFSPHATLYQNVGKGFNGFLHNFLSHCRAGSHIHWECQWRQTISYYLLFLLLRLLLLHFVILSASSYFYRLLDGWWLLFLLIGWLQRHMTTLRSLMVVILDIALIKQKQ